MELLSSLLSTLCGTGRRRSAAAEPAATSGEESSPLLHGCFAIIPHPSPLAHYDAEELRRLILSYVEAQLASAQQLSLEVEAQLPEDEPIRLPPTATAPTTAFSVFSIFELCTVIASFCDGVSLARMSQSHSMLHGYVSEHKTLWSRLCLTEFGVTASALNPKPPSSRELYALLYVTRRDLYRGAAIRQQVHAMGRTLSSMSARNSAALRAAFMPVVFVPHG